MSLAAPLGAVMVERSKTAETCGLFPRQRPEFRHVYKHGQSRARANPINARKQLDLAMQIGVQRKLGKERLQRAAPPGAKPLDLRFQPGNQRFVAIALKPCLLPARIFLDLFDQPQPLLESCQSGIGGLPDLLAVRRTQGNQAGIDPVVLGPLQMKLRIGANLQRLKDDDDMAATAKPRHDIALISSACFDTNAFDPVPSQPVAKLPITSLVIGNLQNRLATAQRHVELVLAGIDPGRLRAMLGHLRLSLPCDANLAFLQPFGPDEEPVAILLRDDPSRSRAFDPTTGAPFRMAVQNGAFLSEQSILSRPRQYKTRGSTFQTLSFPRKREPSARQRCIGRTSGGAHSQAIAGAGFPLSRE